MRLINGRTPGEAFKAALISTLGALTLFGLMMLALPAPAAEHPVYSGPYSAEVIRVVDADTIEAAVDLWPGQTVTVAIRIDGIDTPESWRPKCTAEKAKALRAKNFVGMRVAPGDRLMLTDVANGKYAGRILGTLSRDGPTGPVSIADELIGEGLAVPYHGETKRDWCAPPDGSGKG